MLSPDGDSHHTRSHLALEFVVLCDIEKRKDMLSPDVWSRIPLAPGHDISRTQTIAVAR